MPNYQPNVPNGMVPLNQDYKNLMGNFQSINSQWVVDHVPLTDTSGTPPNGYHTFVHLAPFSTPTTNPPNNYPIVTGTNGPAATAGYGQLFGVTVNDGLSTDSSLYYLSGGALLTQLTRNFEPSNATSGFTFLPGGLILQWGQAPAKAVGSLVVFPMDFTTVPYSITLTPYNSSYDANSHGAPSALGATKHQFQVSNGTGQASTYNLYWMAIGT